MSTQLLTVPQFAARLGVSRATAYRLIAAKRVRVVDIGTGTTPRTRIPDSALAEFIRRNER